MTTAKPASAGSGVSDSEFHMWRAIFALSHADNVVTEEEKRFMTGTLDRVSFSPEQRSILEGDMQIPSDMKRTKELYSRITNQNDRVRFFYFARMLFWSDGDFAEQERRILRELGADQHRNMDGMIGTVENLQLEDEQKEWLGEDMEAAVQQEDRRKMLDLFLKRFRK